MMAPDSEHNQAEPFGDLSAPVLADRPTLHIRNGRAGGHPQTRGAGVTWCGKKLLDKPDRIEPDREIFLSYGAEVAVTFDPDHGSCERCRKAFEVAYEAAFPDGCKPFATFRLDSPEEIERAKTALAPETLSRFLGPGGEGLSAYERFLSGSGKHVGVGTKR